MDQDTAGKTTILFFKKFPSNNVCAIKRFAEDPELTKTDDLIPKYLENFASKFFVTLD